MRRAATCLIALLLPSGALASPAPLSFAPRAPWAPGVVVVVTAPGSGLAAVAGSARAASPELAATLARFGLTHANDLARGALPGVLTVQVTRLRSDLPGFDPVAAAAGLRALPGVVAASPDAYFGLHLTPNDPYVPAQWHLSNSAAAIHASAGWSRDIGSPSQLIAILDTGVDVGHSDLNPKIWVNSGEIAGNGIDDDHDGYVDDVNGWDFGDDVPDPSPEPIFDPATGVDVGWHGTFVAGLAAAATNNGVGVAGVAWNGRILPLKISNPAGDMPLSAVVSAFDFAIAHHATVINCSFGTSDPLAAPVLQALVNQAVANEIVCVASAGNEGTDNPEWPAACDGVVAVASTNASNLRSPWSNWGWYVDCCAPGENVVSTICRNYAYDDYSLLYFQAYLGFDGTHAYMSCSGTSFAAPLVSGAAALLRSHVPGASAADVGWVMGVVGDVKAYDNPIGPKLDLDLLLGHSLAVEPPVGAGATVELAPPAPNPAARSTSMRFTLAREGVVTLAIFDAAGRRVRTIADGTRSAGSHWETWDLCDDTGRPMPAGLYFAQLRAGAASRMRRLAVSR